MTHKGSPIKRRKGMPARSAMDEIRRRKAAQAPFRVRPRAHALRAAVDDLGVRFVLLGPCHQRPVALKAGAGAGLGDAAMMPPAITALAALPRLRHRQNSARIAAKAALPCALSCSGVSRFGVWGRSRDFLRRVVALSFPHFLLRDASRSRFPASGTGRAEGRERSRAFRSVADRHGSRSSGVAGAPAHPSRGLCAASCRER